MPPEEDAAKPNQQPLTTADMRKAYDSLLASLQTLAPRLGDRRAAAELQELGLRLGYLALALSHQMDGDVGKAEQALARADARAARMPSFFSRPEALGGEDWTNVYH